MNERCPRGLNPQRSAVHLFHFIDQIEHLHIIKPFKLGLLCVASFIPIFLHQGPEKAELWRNTWKSWIWALGSLHASILTVRRQLECIIILPLRVPIPKLRRRLMTEMPILQQQPQRDLGCSTYFKQGNSFYSLLHGLYGCGNLPMNSLLLIGMRSYGRIHAFSCNNKKNCADCQKFLEEI
ncbi:hypothetical protein SUGI_0220140 [Cryptomeria japonica]|nr:hypothetical protein SUGI_0220140 [Cryptomeria japonica]